MYKMTYPTPNITGLTELATYANTVTNSSFWNGFVIVTWFILVLSLKSYRTGSAVVAASFVCAIISLIFAILGLVNGLIPVGFVILTGVGALLME
jgi:hypothetical protein